MNKMNSSKKPKKKKKKKGAEDEAAEESFDVDGGEVDGGDESDNEEIENMLDSANLSLEADGDYDYDDLDQVANEDDDDLVGDVSDAEIDVPSDIAEGEDFDAIAADDGVMIFDVPDVEAADDEDGFNQRKRKQKSGGKAGASPFASLEKYEHLTNEDSPNANESTQKKRTRAQATKEEEVIWEIP